MEPPEAHLDSTFVNTLCMTAPSGPPKQVSLSTISQPDESCQVRSKRLSGVARLSRADGDRMDSLTVPLARVAAPSKAY
jgi:hypothetical protein